MPSDINASNHTVPATMSAIVRQLTPARWAMCKVVGLARPAVYTSKLAGLKRATVAVPELPGDEWVLCRTRLGGICGTDLGIVYLQSHPATILQHFAASPVMLGHENVADIVAVGAKAAPLAVGQRIVADPPTSCAARGITPICRACREGHPAICENMDRGALPASMGLGYNNRTGGSWSEYFVAHVSQVHAVPQSISDEQAVLVDPLACSLHAVLTRVPADSDRVLIFGSGMIALGVLTMLRAIGCKAEVTMTVRHGFQADRARSLGADHTVTWGRSPDVGPQALAEIVGARAKRGRSDIRYFHGGFDLAYDCSGWAKGFAQVSRMIRTNGTVILVGTPQLGLTDLTCVWFRELTVMGTTGRAIEIFPGQTTPMHNYRHVLDLLSAKRLDVTPFLPALYRPENYRQALADLKDRSSKPILKAAFDFRS